MVLHIFLLTSLFIPSLYNDAHLSYLNTQKLISDSVLIIHLWFVSLLRILVVNQLLRCVLTSDILHPLGSILYILLVILP
jgi:hypothetical protein